MDRRLFLGAGAFVATLGVGRAARADPVVTVEPDDMTLGDPHARVTVIEYASASCPHCARFNNEVFPAFKAKYIDTGKVYYAFREFLTDPVQVAAAAFLLARCAGKDNYFKVIDGFFHVQDEVYATNQLRTPLLKVAATAGMDETAVNACLADEKATQALNDRVKRYMDRDNVHATPTFVIDGQVLQGERTLAQLSTVVDAALRKARRHRR
jgi:protein-disulfide isomerase